MTESVGPRPSTIASRNAADRRTDDGHLRRVVCGTVGLDRVEHLGLGLVHELVRAAVEPISQRLGLRGVADARLLRPATAREVDGGNERRGEGSMCLPDLGHQIGLVCRYELDPVKIEYPEVHLASGGLELGGRTRCERGGDDRQLIAGRLAKVSVGVGLSLQLGELIGPRVGAFQRLEADDPDDEQEHRQQPERDHELGADRYGEARNETREALYAVSSVCIWRKKAKSDPSATI
jgi:hypothetical protein